MRERLSGNLQQRLRELREEHGYKSMNKLADALEIDRTTYSRIEKGETKTINSDILIKLTELYDVSADYILGLSHTPEKTYDDIAELGLSIEAAKNLYSGKLDARVVNELLTNDKFAVASKMMGTYFEGSVAAILKTQNELLDFSYNLVLEYTASGALPKDDYVDNIKKNLKSSKAPVSKFELTKIEQQLMSAIREIRKKVIDEVNDHQANQGIIYYDIIQAVKDDVDAVPTIKDLPEEQKKEIVIEAMQRAVNNVPDITDEDKGDLATIIEQIAPTLMNLWKRN